MLELGINNHDLFTTWWCCTHGALNRHNWSFNNSWAGLWPNDLNKRFPLLLQKLEEFLFCMEENHPEVGILDALAGCHRCNWSVLTLVDAKESHSWLQLKHDPWQHSHRQINIFYARSLGCVPRLSLVFIHLDEARRLFAELVVSFQHF